MKFTTKTLVAMALLSAIAFVIAHYFHLLAIPVVPAAPYLTLDLKDAVIIIGGFLYGPLAVVMMSAVVSVAEMPFSGTHWVGLVMNMLSTCAFGCTASFIYRRKKDFANAIIGVISGCVVMTIVMLPANWLLTPFYIPISREVVAQMLLPIILPFNLIKGTVNAVLIAVFYKPFMFVFTKSNLE